MPNFTVCRVCLADNIRMHSIANTQLQEIYENLIRTKLNTEDGRPVTICYICHSQLQRCCKLVDLALNSEKLLVQFYHNGIELTQDTVCMLDRAAVNYSVTPIESISLDVPALSQAEEVIPNNSKVILNNSKVILNNSKDETKVEMKYETDHDLEEDMIEVERNDSVAVKIEPNYNNGNLSTDSEDNKPLNALKIAKKTVKQVNRKRKRMYRRDIKIDAIEVKLTKEQQIEAVMARAKSLNYLNSPFKCHLCYKGFVNGVTFSNHTEKHDEISGVYKCEICALRYHSPRLLRTHAATAHEKYYKCNKCGHLSHTSNQARDHERWHDGFMFECQLCTLKFKKRTSFLTHTRKNHPTESVCNLCGYSFVGKNGLLLHKSKSHKREAELENVTVPAAERYCAVCNVQFVGLEPYQRHLISSLRHTTNENNSNECVICKQIHPDHGSLKEHMKVHRRKLLHPNPVVNLNSIQAHLPCDVCGATFISRSRLAAHVNRKHLGRKYARHVICELCGAQFTSAATLRYHQRTHSGSRPYPCGARGCAARFADSNQLRVHARTHSGERPYACLTCHKRFTQKPALNRHYRVHTGAKPYVCQVCSKSFSQSNSLKTHVQTVHLKMPAQRKRKRATPANKD